MTQRKIQSIWFDDPTANGDVSFNVGQFVTSITEHKPRGEGDRWYYDVEFADGHMERLFKFRTVVFDKPTEVPKV